MITHAAVKIIETGEVFKGHRHVNCYRTIMHSHPDRMFSRGDFIEGFCTDTNMFFDRNQSAKIAFECGQIKKQTSFLSSDDLW